MCRGENEPRGPYRCSGDTARELHSAQRAAAKVRNDLSSVKTEIEGVGVKLDAHQARADHLHRAILDATDDESREEIATQIDKAESAVMGVEKQRIALHREARILESKWGAAQRLVDARRSAYDASPNGIADLSRDINDAEERYADAISRKDGGERERINAGTHLSILKARRELAERSAKMEAVQRITNFETQTDVDRRARDFQRWTTALDQAREDRANAQGHDEMLVAETGIENARAHLARIHREENSVSRMNAWVGGYAGARSHDEGLAWRGISSIHKPIRGTDGRLNYRVELQRSVDGVRTRAVIELPAGQAIDYSEVDDASGADRGRYPTTAYIMRQVSSYSRAYEAADGDRRQFTANGGTAGEFDLATKANKALKALLHSDSAPMSAAAGR